MEWRKLIFQNRLGLLTNLNFMKEFEYLRDMRSKSQINCNHFPMKIVVYYDPMEYDNDDICHRCTICDKEFERLLDETS